MDPRVEAGVLADGILAALEQPVAREDLPTIRAVIMECALFEMPMPDLKVAVHSVGSYYNIVVSGYRAMMDDVRWVNTFLGNHRGIAMSSVMHSYTQYTDNSAFKVLQVQKVEMHVAASTSASSSMSASNTRIVNKSGYTRPPLVKRVE